MDLKRIELINNGELVSTIEVLTLERNTLNEEKEKLTNLKRPSDNFNDELVTSELKEIKKRIQAIDIVFDIVHESLKVKKAIEFNS